MVAPEWFGSNTDAASTRLAGQDSSIPMVSTGNDLPAVLRADPAADGSAAISGSTEVCQGLLVMGAAVLGRCATFFEPVVLAQLDAALAHEFARQAQSRAGNAAHTLELAISRGHSTEALEHLAHQGASAKMVANKAESRAALATAVITSLGGTVTEDGFDPDIVAQVSGASLIDAIAMLEEAKNALSAVQAQAQAIFVAQQRLDQAKSGLSKERLGQGIAQQVALARHESPYRGRQLCELSEVLVREMPYSMNAFTTGKISEYRASLIVKETAFLSFEDRAQVDKLICGNPDAAALLGTRELSSAARKAAYELDPEAFLKRHEKAIGDRYVSLRPAPDGMTFLTALIPLKQGVRILATLTRVADSAKASGDERGKGQIMADALMHRLIQHNPCDEGAGTLSDHRGVQPENSTGETWAQVPGTTREPWCTTVGQPEIALELIMTDRSLFGGAKDSAVLVGYGPIPAPIARNMTLGDGDGDGFSPRVWLKRLFTHPDSNALLAMDSKSRLFPEGMKEFLRIQDQRCQTPYCDAPIREYDHVKAYAAGGTTTIENGQGLCTACNQAKEALGWSFERGTGPENGCPSTEVITPTGHRYISTAPPLPGPTRTRSRQQCGSQL